MAPTFAEMVARDAGSVFLAGPATGFGVKVTNGATSCLGIVEDRYVTDELNGFMVQRKVKVLRLKTGAGGTIESGTVLVVDGVRYRVDLPEPVAPDRVFTDYTLAGGVA